MARGQLAKESIKNKILEVFEGAFTYSNGKELRIPFDEGNGEIQIKVALTAAKDNVSPEGEVERAAATASETAPTSNFPQPKTIVEPTPEEKQNIEHLLKALGLD